MQPAIALQQKLSNNQIVTGMLVTDHIWPRLPEIAQRAGLDYLIIDCEHGPHTDEQVAHACQVGRLLNFAVLVRTVSTDYATVRRAIDLGPCGLMFPCVDNTDQLDEARDAIWMPPRGRRRPGGWGNSWMQNFQYDTWKTDFEDHFIVIPQIESKPGLDNADAIAQHELVTALAMGPYDLSAELGCCWDPTTPEFKAAAAKLREAADAAGKRFWAIGKTEELLEQGYTFLCVGEPSAMLEGAIGQAVRAAAGSNAPAAKDLPVA